jgi:hypothetical protein
MPMPAVAQNFTVSGARPEVGVAMNDGGCDGWAPAVALVMMIAQMIKPTLLILIDRIVIALPGWASLHGQDLGRDAA